jgi:hypothetical protein
LGTIKGQKLTQSSSYHFHVSEYIWRNWNKPLKSSPTLCRYKLHFFK